MSGRTSTSTPVAPDRSKPRASAARPEPVRKPRLGFLGVGWIGRRRMKAIADAGLAEIAGIADPDDESRAACDGIAEDAIRLDSFDALLSIDDLDGVVIATPSALHARQAVRALERGLAVYCQKPLGRTAAETERVVEAARAADRMLGVDLCYRHTAAARAVKEQVESGELGEPFAADLVFHNAYGPDGSWYYRPELAGGGCLMDLGIHLVDLAFWLLDDRDPRRISGHLFSEGERLTGSPGAAGRVEDYAAAELELADGRVARIACSWRLPAGRDAVIEATVYGTRGAARLRNLNGSFFDFTAERLDRRSCTRLTGPPDDWEPRGIAAWARRLADGVGFDPAIEEVCPVARTLDAIYGSCTSC